MDKKKKVMGVLFTLTIIFTIIGSTFVSTIGAGSKFLISGLFTFRCNFCFSIATPY